MARGGAQGFFVGFRGGAKHFFGALRGGANLFFCPPDVVFISDDHVINATSLTNFVFLFNFQYTSSVFYH